MIELEKYNLIPMAGALPFSGYPCINKKCDGHFVRPDNSNPRPLKIDHLDEEDIRHSKQRMAEIIGREDGKLAAVIVICDTCYLEIEHAVGIIVPKD